MSPHKLGYADMVRLDVETVRRERPPKPDRVCVAKSGWGGCPRAAVDNSDLCEFHA